VESLEKLPSLKKLNLGTVAKNPPKKRGGLNIEGLVPSGKRGETRRSDFLMLGGLG